MIDFINECREEVKEIGEGKYCVIITAGKNMAQRPRFIYKNLDEFEKKYEKDVASIDSMFGVDVQLWIFD